MKLKVNCVPRLRTAQPMRPGRSSQNSFRSRLPTRGFSSLLATPR